MVSLNWNLWWPLGLTAEEVAISVSEDRFGCRPFWRSLWRSFWTSVFRVCKIVRLSSATSGAPLAAAGWPDGEIYWNREPSTKLETNNFSLNLKVLN